MTEIAAKPAGSDSDNGTDAMRAQLLLHETNHRCSNDLQLVVSLLALQSRRAANLEVRWALTDAMERVAILARARSSMHGERQSLNAALHQVCEALHAQAEPRQIDVLFEPGGETRGLSATCITTLTLVANELATNAIKHAFEEGTAGRVRMSVRTEGHRVIVLVDDDGLPFPELGDNSVGLGMGLVKRMMTSIDGELVLPLHGTKVFELHVLSDDPPLAH